MPNPAIHSHWICASGRSGAEGDATARFPYWSFTKTVIAVCALQMVEEGLLRLEDRPDGRPWTLGQLLGHRSGLPDYGQLEDYRRAVANHETPWPREIMLDRALARGALFAPGKGWAYSNIGSMFAREMVEAAAGRDFGALVAERIAEPLGLDSVELARTREHFARLHWKAAASYDPRWVYHGCLIGSAADAARLLHALFQGRLLQPATLALMLETTPLGAELPGRPWTSHGYALGLMSGEAVGVGRMIGHSGGGPFCVNAVHHFPDLADRPTVACFAEGVDEGVVEGAAVRLAGAL